MALESGPNQRVLVGYVRDQAHLYGLLDRLRDFGIEMPAVKPAGMPDARSTPGLPRGPFLRVHRGLDQARRDGVDSDAA